LKPCFRQVRGSSTRWPTLHFLGFCGWKPCFM
jgi:hypothetical protein